MIDFDAVVLGPCQDVFGYPAIVTPVVSAPQMAPFPIRGIYDLKPADLTNEDALTTRMDNYTFGVRVSELPIQVQRGDRVSNIGLPFLAGMVFTIEDTGDDGFGNQEWVLKAENLNPPIP